MPNTESNIHYLSVVESNPISTMQTIAVDANPENPDLNDFKKQLDHLPYYIHKKNVFKYRIIFVSLGLLFIGLALFVFLEKTSWFCNMLFTNCYLVQASLSGLCLLLSATAMCIAYHIRPEKEAVQHLAQRAKQRITKIYSQKCPHFGFGWLLILRGDKQAATLLKAYHDAADKLHELKTSTLALVRHVANSQHLDFHNKEQLFNQALLELKEKLNWIVRSFHS